VFFKKNPKNKSNIRIDVPKKDLEKFKEVLLYILKKLESKQYLSKTVIYKILYFSDFDYYEKYEEQLIGLIYIKNTHGPTPLEFGKVIREMLQNGDLALKKDKYSPNKYDYIPLKNPDFSILKPNEIDIIDNVIERFGNMNAVEISEYSHGDVPWIGTDFKEPIKYESVFYRTSKYSIRKTEFDKNDEIDIFVDDTYD